MANFPTSPTTGDTFHSGSNLYSWTGTAWKIVAGDRPDYGVVTFDPESSSPSAIAGKSQIYAKDVPNTPPAVLLHFDDNWNNTGSGGNATAVGPPTFEASTVTGTGFNKQIDLTV